MAVSKRTRVSFAGLLISIVVTSAVLVRAVRQDAAGWRVPATSVALMLFLSLLVVSARHLQRERRSS